MATAEKLADAFDELGFDLEAGKVTDRLAALCGLHGLGEEKISFEYMAFLSRKKLAINRAPDLALLEDFDRDLAKQMPAKVEQKALITKTTGMTFMDDEGEEEEEEDGAMSYYSCGASTPIVSRKKRPLSSPAEESVKKRLSSSTTQDMDQTLSPSSYPGSSGVISSGKTYAGRKDIGKVVIRFGDDVPTVSDAKWTNTSAYQVDYKMVSKTHPGEYRYMFERLRERAGHLDETICSIGDILTEKYKLEPQDFCQPSPQTLDAVGRICCDSEGRLNARSLVLQGNQDVVRGRTMPLDASQVANYSLFPGQVVGAKATNPTGHRLVATEVMADASMAGGGATRKRVRQELQIVVASGPYTTTDNFSYEPLHDLLAYVGKHNPHILVLCGPFVDAKHPKLESCDVTFDQLFATCMKTVAEAVQDTETTVLVVPSAARDVHHSFVYPTPPFEASKTTTKIKMVSDPCVVDIEGLTLGITATDILFHLGKEEISFPPRSGDRLRRLASHLLQQRSFYPLYPPNDEINLDMEQLENMAGLEVKPDVLILPSDLLHFFKDIDGTLAMNPQRLSRGEGGGVFARLKVIPSDNESDKKRHSMSAEIVRI